MKILRSVLAVVTGIVVGSIVNMSLIMLGVAMIPVPAGVDPMDAESLARGMHLFEVKHFIFPFLAHAAGTLVGALVGGYIGWQHRKPVILIIATAFFIGGLVQVLSMPAPVIFEVVDLLFAYFPMAIGALWILSKPGKSTGA